MIWVCSHKYLTPRVTASQTKSTSCHKDLSLFIFYCTTILTTDTNNWNNIIILFLFSLYQRKHAPHPNSNLESIICRPQRRSDHHQESFPWVQTDLWYTDFKLKSFKCNAALLLDQLLLPEWQWLSTPSCMPHKNKQLLFDKLIVTPVTYFLYLQQNWSLNNKLSIKLY
jgi:hypothetical protein